MDSRVYALLDKGVITRIEGEYTLPTDLDGWTLIDYGTPCDRLNLAQTHYLPKSLTDERGVYRYKYVMDEDGAYVEERTEAEMDADYRKIPKPKYTQTIELSREDFDLLDVEDEVIYHIYEEDGTMTVKMGVNA